MKYIGRLTIRFNSLLNVFVMAVYRLFDMIN